MKKLKIAITCKDSSRIWTNGLTQNAYFLIGLLNEAGYEAEAVSQFEEAGKNLEEFEIKKLSTDTIKNYDIVIEVCYSVTDNLLDYALKNGIKLVTINYGNILMLMQEDLVLNPGNTPAVNRGGFDTWISPHFEFSKGFVETTSKGPVSICPYIWDPKIFNKFCKDGNIDPFYKNNKNINKIGIFESNINIIKTCIYPLLSLEKLEREDKNIIKEILIFNGTTIKENAKFKEITSNFDVVANKKLSVESRYPLPTMIGKGYVGSILSHQFYCDLNYLVLEGLYMGIPVIHNSEACKEAGYFYSTFDSADCVRAIKESIANHDHKIEEYKKSASEVLYKFSAKNEENIKNYKYLIENIS
jgi:hypothetical protein